ncbi:hypothetical protein N7474_002810 [Penicillium riverlandense]|uniref:uncharacterized protein n=1 Tax=Penicillium riverlandense TaxID=1903569 RepID=UPI0025472921|nr:uncharacterized protein N7474_002810 [Penicillium riverlandense]KAJ5825672.1 hypothetical protein N7474_002810 [Penicillium riverlandense]
MPVLTLHLLALTSPTNLQPFIQQLKQTPNLEVILTSRPRHVVIHPTTLDNNPLTKTPWDLMVLLKSASSTTNPIPSNLHSWIKNEYKVPTGIPSRLLSTYPTRDADLKQSARSASLTGSLDKVLRDQGKSNTAQNLEISPELLEFMTKLSKTHSGPVTMLNLLQFHYPNGKESYYQYGQAFIPIAGKRGGSAKLVGAVVNRSSSPESTDSRGGSPPRPETEWWNEVSIVHYPSIRHFCDMLAGEDYQGINEKYRLSALRDTFLLCTTEFDVEEGAGVAKL